MKFRKLKAEEIEIRRGRNFDNGYSELLLYQDCRCSYNLMDETFGNDWQCDYKEVNGVTYCGIGVKDKETSEWIWRWNAGSEGEFEKEKAVASSAFKRACVALGIGRELYTAPRILVQADKYDTFSVKEIEYQNDKISLLKVINQKGDVVFFAPGGANTRWSYETPGAPKTGSESSPKIDKTNAEKLKDFCSEKKSTEDTKVLKKFYEFYENKANDFEHFNPSKLWDKWKSNERR